MDTGILFALKHPQLNQHIQNLNKYNLVLSVHLKDCLSLWRAPICLELCSSLKHYCHQTFPPPVDKGFSFDHRSRAGEEDVRYVTCKAGLPRSLTGTP